MRNYKLPINLTIIQLLFAWTVGAEIINIPDDEETIQGGIDAAEDGDAVLVSPGEYVENINFNGKAIAIIGNTENPGEVVIDGDSSGTVVTFDNGEGLQSTLSGFTIQNGFVEQNGGGIRVSESSPRIYGCIIRNNSAGTRGGGISCEPNASPSIVGCTITENESGSGGGGIWLGDNSSPEIFNCRILENYARWNGGGVNMYIDCNPVITNCLIQNNSAGLHGGGIIVSQGCSPVIERCEISHNLSDDRGGGIFIERQATPTFRNCLEHNNGSDGEMGLGLAIVENSAPRFINCNFNFSWTHLDWVIESFFISASHPVFINCILYYNSLPDIYFDPDSAASSITIAYSDIQGGRNVINTNDNGEVNWLDGNIDEVPEFIDFNEDNFNLAENSPCVDAGTAFFVWEDDTLLNLSEDEYNGNAPDIGALESEYVNNVGDDGSVILDFRLDPVYPNPFNSTVQISYVVPKASHVSINMYDITGSLVAEIVSGEHVAGQHTAIWDASHQPSGIYFADLMGERFTQTIKLILMK